MRLRAHVVLARDGLDVDARLSSRANTVLMGPPGSGKSAVLACIAGRLTPDRGKIRLDGRTLFDHEASVSRPPEERRVALVPSGLALFPHLTVLRNVLFAVRGDGRWERARELLARFALSEVAHRMPGTLDGAERLRVALARAAGSDPELLLLDEPLGAVPRAQRERALHALADWLWESPIPALVVTEDPVVARELASHLVVLERGRVVQVGKPGDVAVRPATEYVAALTAGLIAQPAAPREAPRALSEDEEE